MAAGSGTQGELPGTGTSDQKPRGTEEASGALVESFQAEGASKLASRKRGALGTL